MWCNHQIIYHTVYLFQLMIEAPERVVHIVDALCHWCDYAF
jgi:hypothetical protein